VYSPEQLPYATEKPHPYFTAPEGQTLAESLRNSAGRDAQLISFQMESGWLITTWGGLVVMSGNEGLDDEMSSGNGQRCSSSFQRQHCAMPSLRCSETVQTTFTF
jgi:hypothetical protein